MKGVNNKIIEDYQEISTLTAFLLELEEDKQLKSKLKKIKEICNKYLGGVINE